MLPDDPDTQARFFYLALLGMVLAAGLFRFYRARLGQALQHAAIWGLILAGLMIAYGFKDELVSQLFPDRARSTGGSQVELRRARDGHFYARAHVNGTELRLMVDTGASSVVLSQADAARIGLEPESLSYTVPASTANGTVMGAPVTLERVEIGPLAASDVRALVNSGELGTSLLGISRPPQPLWRRGRHHDPDPLTRGLRAPGLASARKRERAPPGPFARHAGDARLTPRSCPLSWWSWWWWSWWLSWSWWYRHSPTAPAAANP